MEELPEEEHIEYQEIGDSVIMEREFWNRVVLWLSKHGVKVEQKRQHGRGIRPGTKTAKFKRAD